MSNPRSIHPSGLYMARLKGVISGNAPAGQTTTFEWTAPEDLVMNGADYVALNHNHSDQVSFQVHHPVAGLLDEFANELYVRSEYRKELYGARLYAGLIIKVVYKNNGTNAVDFNMNLDLHKRV